MIIKKTPPIDEAETVGEPETVWVCADCHRHITASPRFPDRPLERPTYCQVCGSTAANEEPIEA